jgi:Glycosyltransferases involved in cell wall biogenesis
MLKNPKFSIIIPTLNEEKYLPRLLKSIKSQDYKNYEIIVVDSHSTDMTESIARHYNARVLLSKKGNIARAKNTGIKAACGEIIAFIDADMVLANGLLHAVHLAFRDDTKLAAVEPSQKLNKEDTSKKNSLLFNLVTKLVWLNKEITFKTHFPAATGCVFCRRNLVAKAGLFNERLLVSEDREYYHRLSKYGTFRIISNYALVSFRRQEKEGLIKPALKYYKSDVSSFLLKSVKKGMKPER